MPDEYMNDDQRHALRTLRQAHALYRQADAHRTELTELCKVLKVPMPAIRDALGKG